MTWQVDLYAYHLTSGETVRLGPCFITRMRREESYDMSNHRVAWIWHDSKVNAKRSACL